MNKFLLIIDGTEKSKSIVSILQGEGYIIASSPDQQEALATLKSEEIDVVLLDLDVQEIDINYFPKKHERDLTRYSGHHPGRARHTGICHTGDQISGA